MYRTELRKLNKKIVCSNPELCLQFTQQALSQLPLPLSTAPTSDVDVAISLVYQYCEGIRPPPGMKVVMRNETFRNLLAGLHLSEEARALGPLGMIEARGGNCGEPWTWTGPTRAQDRPKTAPKLREP